MLDIISRFDCAGNTKFSPYDRVSNGGLKSFPLTELEAC